MAINVGEWVAIVGRSGSGRSTLLDTLRGASPPDSGSVFFDGNDLYGKLPCPERYFGFVGRHFDLRSKILQHGGTASISTIVHSYLKSFHGVTVEDAVSIIASLRLPSTMPHDAVQGRIYSSLDAVDMSDKGHKLLKELNPGQLVRLRLALELVTRPRVVFLDEATSECSQDQERRVIDVIRQLTQRGCTVVSVSASQLRIDECDMIAFMDCNRNAVELMFYGSLRDALTFYRVNNWWEIPEGWRSEGWLERFRNSAYYETNIRQRLQEPTGSPKS